MLCILFKVRVPKQCCGLENMMNLIASYFNHNELLMLQVRESGEIARSNYSPNVLEIMRTSIDLFTCIIILAHMDSCQQKFQVACATYCLIYDRAALLTLHPTSLTHLPASVFSPSMFCSHFIS